MAITGYAQEKIITGKVIDSRDGSVLPGVSVTAKGAAGGTQTSADGTYRITVSPSATILVFTSVGFGTQEVAINNRSSVNVQLTLSNVALGEVVVSTGYGTVRRKDLTGSITTVGASEFAKGPTASPEALINGKVAGVQITNGGGAPGTGVRILIRGGASLSASNAPLIVIDGVPLDNGGISGAANPLSLINPNDIETFNILKDASATAIYGNRASNGVIIITTKKGKAGALKVNFSTVFSVYTPTEQAEVLNDEEFRNLVNTKGNTNMKNLLGSANTNWQDEVFQTALGTDNNISFTGGIANLPYRLSLGYLNQEGVLITGKLQRMSANLNLSPVFLNKHLKADINFRASHNDTRFANEGAIGSAAAFDPTQSVHNTTGRFGGYFEWLDNNRPYGLAPRNPVGLLKLREDNSNVNRYIGNVQLDYKLHWLPELRANLNVGFDHSQGEGTVVVPDSAGQAYLNTSPSGQQTSGLNNEYEQTKDNKLFEFYLNYSKDIRSIQSSLDVLAGYSYQDFKTKAPAFPQKGYNGVEFSPAPPNPFETQNTLVSFFGRVRYGYKNKYLLTASLRRDGSSRFNPDVRWGMFPAFALAWNITEESFLKTSKAFSNLKIRVGYGETGQQDIGSDYPYIARYTLGTNTATYQFGNNFYPVYRPVGYDANIKWEETSTYNVGLDFGFLDGRINGSVDFYYKKTEDLLNIIPVPAGTNFTNEIFTNVGNMENRGVEFSINGNVIKDKKFNWNLGVNVTYNQNEITKLTQVSDPNYQGVLTGGISGGVGNTIQIHSVGYQRSSFFVLQQVYDNAGKPIEGLYVDRNKDGIINNNDYYRYKEPDPDVFIGVNSMMTYENWSLHFVVRSNIGNYMYNNVYSGLGTFQAGSQSYLYNRSVNVLETEFQNSQYFSDYYMENATFLRMDNLTIGYDFGKSLIKKANVRATFNIQNPFVISDYRGVDPEIANGIDNNFYPRPRVYSLGINLDF
jgi:iron complex outermembrane receptor protein